MTKDCDRLFLKSLFFLFKFYESAAFVVFVSTIVCGAERLCTRRELRFGWDCEHFLFTAVNTSTSFDLSCACVANERMNVARKKTPLGFKDTKCAYFGEVNMLQKLLQLTQFGCIIFQSMSYLNWASY